MIAPLLHKLEQLLPLKIDRASWSGEVLSLVGGDWNFNAVCSWRVIKDERILFACYDDDIAEKVDALSGANIVRVHPQSMAVSVDPMFELSTGALLEIFSTDTHEPWTMRIPTGEKYVASPSDKNAFAE